MTDLAAYEPSRPGLKNGTFGEGPTWILIAVIYAGWLGLTLSFRWAPWWLILPAAAWLIAWHNSFQHEAVHGHPSRYGWLNDSLAWPPLGLWLPYPVYRDSHRAHHQTPELTDPFDDPESWYLAGPDWRRASAVRRKLLIFNNTLAGRMIIGPLLIAGATWRNHFLAILRGDCGYCATWLSHIAACSALLLSLWRICDISPIEYLVFFAWPGLSLSLVRSFYEHRPGPVQDGRTAVVDAGPVMSFLFLNNNLHVAHHDRPDLPWYALPRYYRGNRSAILARASGFHFDGGYLEIFRRFAFRAKDLPVHPCQEQVEGSHPKPSLAQEQRKRQ